MPYDIKKEICALQRTFVLLLFIVCLPVLSFAQTASFEDDGEKQRAISALKAQIDAQQKIINSLTTKEANAKNKKNAALSEANKAKKEALSAEKEYKDALAFLKANPQSQTSRRTVDIAQQRFEEANTSYGNKESQAKVENDLHRAAEGELKKEKANLEELRQTLEKLNIGIIAPQHVLSQIPAKFIPAKKLPQEALPSVEENNDKKDDDKATQISDNVAPQTSVVSVDNVIIQSDNNDERRKRYFVFSARSEFVAGLMDNSITAIGGSVEAGVIKRGFYITGDLSGGVYYVGSGANVGYCFNNEGVVKLVLGAALGLHYTAINVDFTRNGEKIISGKGENISFAGVFIKLLGGSSKNFDISYKLLFGSGHIPTLNEKDDGDYEVMYGEENITVRHSLGLGYTVLRKTGGNTK
jgi:hypothetical protein